MKQQVEEIREKINLLRKQLEKLIEEDSNNQDYIYTEEMLTKALNGLHK